MTNSKVEKRIAEAKEFDQKMKKEFAQRLYYQMKVHGKNQTELALYLGVSPSSVTHWMKGRKMPSNQKVNMMCQFFNCKRSDLIDDNLTYSSEDEDIRNNEEFNERMKLVSRIESCTDEQIDIIFKLYDLVVKNDVDDKLLKQILSAATLINKYNITIEELNKLLALIKAIKTSDTDKQ